jgi:hypothetical protein
MKNVPLSLLGLSLFASSWKLKAHIAIVIISWSSCCTQKHHFLNEVFALCSSLVHAPQQPSKTSVDLICPIKPLLIDMHHIIHIYESRLMRLPRINHGDGKLYTSFLVCGCQVGFDGIRVASYLLFLQPCVHRALGDTYGTC